MPHTVIGSEQRRRSGRSLSWRLSWRLSSRTCRVRYTISTLRYSYICTPPPPGSGARYLKLRYAGPVRALVRIGGACTQLVSVHAAYHFLGAVPVVHVVDTLVAQGIVSVSSGSLYKLQSEIAVHYAARAGHPAAARSGDRYVEAYSYHMEVRHGPARFLVGVARSMASIRAVVVEPQRLKRSWKLMAASPHRLPCSISKCVLVLKCSSAYSP